MANTNDGTIYRFEDGGTIAISRTGGTENLAVLNVLSGTLRLRPKARATIEPDHDRGVLQARIRAGDEQPALCDFDVKYMTDLDADDLLSLLLDEGDGGATDFNYLPGYTIVVTVFTGPGKVAGQTHTFTNASRAEVPVITAGEQFDTVNARFIATGYARAAYSAS